MKYLQTKLFGFLVLLLALPLLIFILQQQQNNQQKASESGISRGYLTSPQELQIIKQKAESGKVPYEDNLAELIQFVGTPDSWPYGTISGSISCPTRPEPAYINDGAQLIYAKTLAYHLTGNAAYAQSAREKLLDLLDTHTFGGNVFDGSNACILGLAWSVPSLIQAADLLEGYTSWTTQDKSAFQDWLINEVYKKVAWASRVRHNNWGSGGSLSSNMIADYLADRPTATLSEVQPVAKSLTPAQAYTEHRQMQLDRINTTWPGDSLCTIHGIQSHGGIPDELRRGTTGCTGTYLVTTDSSYDYQATHVETAIYHAEFLLRRGDNALYTNKKQDGSGSILQAIKFVIANPTQSFDWVTSKKGTLHVAYRYYKDQSILTRLQTNNQFIKSGLALPFGRVTHDFDISDPTDTPSLPPIVSPPGTTPTPTIQVPVNVWNRHIIDATSRGADGIKLADVNTDTLMDIVTNYEEGGTTRVLKQPTGSAVKNQWLGVTVGLTPNAEDAVFGDIDGNGSIDVVTSTELPNNKMYINWAPADPSTYFDATQWLTESIPAAPAFPWMFAQTIQLDGKNGIDIIAGTKRDGDIPGSGVIGWFESPPNPREISQWKWHKISDTGWTMSIILSDMDNDGDQDIVTSDRNGSRWLTNPGQGIAQTGIWTSNQITTGDTRFMTLADVDKDGLTDAVSTIHPDKIRFSRRLNNTGTSWQHHTISWPAVAGSPKGIAVGDLNKDGKNDLVLSSVNAGTKEGVVWMTYTNTPTEQIWQTHSVSGIDGTKYDLVELVDLDKDGDLDVLTTEEIERLGVLWYENPLITNSLSPTVSPTPHGTVLSMNIKLHGIGNGGDVVNPTSQGNMNPLRAQRNVTVDLYSAINNAFAGSTSGTIVYNPQTGMFSGTLVLPPSFPSTGYNLRVTSQGYLVTLLLGIPVSANQTNTIPIASLVTGDINDDKSLDILDYNLLVSCYGSLGSSKPSTCTESNNITADLYDDGNVNFIDLNLWLREFSKKT